MNYLSSVGPSVGVEVDGSPVCARLVEASRTGRGSSLELIDAPALAAIGRVVRGERRLIWQRLADWLGVTQ